MLKLVLFTIAVVACAWLTDDARAQSSAPFCVTWSGGTECRFYSAQDCRQRAADVDGACTTNGAAGSSGTSSNWFDNALGSYEAGARARREREAERQQQRVMSSDAFVSQFCDRMLDHDMALLNQFSSRLSQEEFNAAANSYVNRATYCQRMASGERP
jgi:hypothetical protein